MSAFGSKADIDRRRRDVCSVPNATSLHCSTFAPIIGLIGAVITLQRLNLLIVGTKCPLARSMPRTRRCGRIHLSRRDSHHEALSKTRSRDGLARTSKAYAESLADEYLGKIL